MSHYIYYCAATRITIERLGRRFQCDYMQLNPDGIKLLVIGLTNRGFNRAYIDALFAELRGRIDVG